MFFYGPNISLSTLFSKLGSPNIITPPPHSPQPYLFIPVPLPESNQKCFAVFINNNLEKKIGKIGISTHRSTVSTNNYKTTNIASILQVVQDKHLIKSKKETITVGLNFLYMLFQLPYEPSFNSQRFAIQPRQSIVFLQVS